MNWKLLLFVVFAFAFVTILAIVQMAVNLSFEIIVLPQLAPALAYLVTILFFRNLYKPIITNFNKIILFKAFIAVIFPFTIFSFIYFIGKIIGIGTEIPENLFKIITAGLIGIIIGGITEEIGWRSFFQPSLEKKQTVFISSLIVGITWGIWHIGHFRNGPIFMLCFLFFTISVSIIIAFLLKSTQYNIIISSLFHISINISFATYFTNGFENIKYFAMNSFIWLMVAVIILIGNRRYYFTKAK